MTASGSTELGPARRFAAVLAAWSMLVLASPGVLAPDGVAALASIALVPWALAASLPGRRAFVVEWLAGGIGSAAMCAWSAYVWSGTLAFLVLVPGLYAAAAGAVLRRLAVRFPLAVAAPAAWVLLEVLRHRIEPPFGFGWMRLGTSAHALAWLAGSARVCGVYGLSFALAALAGALADVVRRRTAPQRARAHWSSLALGPWIPLALGVAPVALAALASALSGAPETAPGPRVLLVQPAFEQRRKMEPRNARDLFAESCALTARGLADARREGYEPDLVAWGETMLPLPIMAPDLSAAWRAGARPPGWVRDQLDPRAIQTSGEVEAAWIGGILFGDGGEARILPEGASFLSGAEYFLARDAEIRRANAIVLWNARGERAGVGGKIHLVPGAEDLVGLERVSWVRASAFALASYVPDLVPFERTEVLALEARDGRSYRFGVTVCFDNAFDDPYTAPLREGPLDFHLVCSNEAWYETSFEMDQMVAFSRLIAIQTGRSIVRATNAGVTVVIAPDGREVARLERNGRDRMVSGAACVAVPVPVRAAERPPYVAAEPFWLAGWILGPLVLCAVAVRGERRSRVTAIGEGARGRSGGSLGRA